MVVVGSSKLKSQQIALSLSLSPPPDLICFGRGELCAAAAGTTLSGRSGWATIYNDHIGKASTTTTRLCVMWDLRCLRRHRKSRQLFSFPLLYIFFLVHLHIRYYRTRENILFFFHRDEIKVEFYYIKCLLMESKAMLTCPSIPAEGAGIEERHVSPLWNLAGSVEGGESPARSNTTSSIFI